MPVHPDWDAHHVGRSVAIGRIDLGAERRGAVIASSHIAQGPALSSNLVSVGEAWN